MTEPKRPRGRPPVTEAQRLIYHPLRLTAAQIAKLEALGGAAWVRRMIDRAKLVIKDNREP